MDMRDALLKTFADECDEILAELERQALALAGGSDDTRTHEAMFRATHTLKGNASCLGFDGLTRVAHHLEEALAAALAGTVSVADGLAPLVLAALDALWRHVGACSAGDDLPVDAAEVALCERLDAWARAPRAAVAVAQPDRSASVVGAGAVPARARAIRVDVARLDQAMDLVGELAVARGRLADTLTRHDFGGAQAAQQAADPLFEDLHRLVLELRLVPLRSVFERFHRAVRDLAAGAGKAARLELRCDDVDVDMAVAEVLRAPFAHLLRNAIDHGIEAPAARTRAGKPAVGLLTLSARRDGGTLAVELGDDGAGLDRERLLERGRRLGLPTAGLADEDILELAFAPGLSTAERVTDLSGRGIGMDVVRRTIEAMRGSVSLASVPGRGATVTLRVPLALSIIQGLAMGVGGEICVLPLDHVVECVELDAARVVASAHGGVLELRGEALPFLDLGCGLGFSRDAALRPRVVVVEHDGRRAGLAVASLIGEVQTVIKPLGRLFETVRGIAGSAVLGDGRIALVVDVRGLMRAAA